MKDFIDNLTARSRIGGPRVLRDGERFTPDAGEEIARRLRMYLAKIDRTEDWAALSMGEMVPRLREAMASPAAHEAIMRAVDKWLELQSHKLQAPRPTGFVKTRVAQQMYAVGRCCIQNNGMAVIHGPAGVGKTMAVRALHADTPGSIYISVRTAGQTATAVMEQIAAALHMAIKCTRARLFSAIEAALRDSDRLLIVDEIHKLEGRRNDEALHCLRDLHDSTGIPMLWVGMTNIAHYIQSGHAAGYEPLDQLYSRIGLWLDLTEVAQGDDGGPGLATIEDIRAMVAARELRVTSDAERYLLRLANELGAGAYRTLDRLLQLAARLGDGAPMDAAYLRRVQTRRLGIRAAETLETRMATRAAKAVGA